MELSASAHLVYILAASEASFLKSTMLNLTIYIHDLSQISLSKKVQDSEVTHIFATHDGNVVTASQSRILRKVFI